MVDSRHIHLVATKHVMRHLKGTLDRGVIYTSDSEFRLSGYNDSDCSGSVEDRKSTSGCCFGLGSCVISWLSRNKTSVSLTTSKDEYIAACSSCRKKYGFTNYWQDCLISR